MSKFTVNSDGDALSFTLDDSPVSERSFFWALFFNSKLRKSFLAKLRSYADFPLTGSY